MKVVKVEVAIFMSVQALFKMWKPPPFVPAVDRKNDEDVIPIVEVVP